MNCGIFSLLCLAKDNNYSKEDTEYLSEFLDYRLKDGGLNIFDMIDSAKYIGLNLRAYKGKRKMMNFPCIVYKNKHYYYLRKESNFFYTLVDEQFGTVIIPKFLITGKDNNIFIQKSI